MRGLPYLNVLSRSADIILIQEHWLWPYELHKLSSYLPEYTSSGRADHRLTESSGLSRGCGGVGILWKKSLNVGVSRKISASDRICTVDISLSCQSPDTLTLVNIYCPSADHNEAEYAQCLQDLEELVCMHDLETCAIIIAGDFNAHLGTLAGPRGTGTPNSRGLLLKQLIDRNSLFVASHSQQSFGPNYTYIPLR